MRHKKTESFQNWREDDDDDDNNNLIELGCDEMNAF
jgi:hypothetical protein